MFQKGALPHLSQTFFAPPPHLLFSAFILLLSSRPMLSLCSVYSCLMSSLAASDFSGFRDATTLRAGRTARLCCTISEISLRGEGRGVRGEGLCSTEEKSHNKKIVGVLKAARAYFGTWGPKMASKSSSISTLLVEAGSSSTCR